MSAGLSMRVPFRSKNSSRREIFFPRFPVAARDGVEELCVRRTSAVWLSSFPGPERRAHAPARQREGGSHRT